MPIYENRRNAENFVTFSEADLRKIICGCCGHNYNHKFGATNRTWRSSIWMCSHQNNYSRKVCTSSRIKDEVLIEKFIEAYNEFIDKKPDNKIVQEIRKRIDDLIAEEQELTALKVNHLIEQIAYNQEVEKVREEIKENTQELNKHLMRDKYGIISTIRF